MTRCPLKSCTCRPPNTRALRQSLRAHCGAYHKTAYRYRYRFPIQRGCGEFAYPPEPEAEGSQNAPQGAVGVEERPGMVSQIQQIGTGQVGRSREDVSQNVAPQVPDQVVGHTVRCPQATRLVNDGTRYRRGRRTDGQPKLPSRNKDWRRVWFLETQSGASLRSLRNVSSGNRGLTKMSACRCGHSPLRR